MTMTMPKGGIWVDPDGTVLPTPKVGDQFIRIVDVVYTEYNDVKLRVDRYRVTKLTPKGVRICLSTYPIMDKNVLSTTRKIFAAPSTPLALQSFIARKKRQVEIQTHALRRSTEALRLGKLSKVKLDAGATDLVLEDPYVDQLFDLEVA